MANYQHLPVNSPAKWSGDERRFAQNIEKLFDELYRRIGELESILKMRETRDGMGYAQIKAKGNMVTEVDEYMVESADDVANLPTTALPGSIAYTADLSYVAQKDLDGTWASILEPVEEVENDG